MINATLRAVVLVLLSALAVPAAAASFEVRRAISMDLWVTWPDAARWNSTEVIDAFPEWRRYVTVADFAALKGAGYDAVRVPIEPAFLLHSDDPGRRAAILEGIDRALDMILSSGLNAIVNLHTIPRGDGDDYAGTTQVLRDPAQFDRYVAIVAAVSNHLAGRPADRVAFEFINEPTLDCYDGGERDDWAGKLARLHRAARDANAAITLVLTGACGGSADGLAAVDPAAIGDDNVIWTFHSYDPFIVTHQGATWGGDIVAHLRDIPWPLASVSAGQIERIVADNEARIREALYGLAERRALGFLRDHTGRLAATDDPAAVLSPPFETVADWADVHGIARERIFLGEFGMIGREWGTDLDVPVRYRLNYMRAMIGQAEARGFGWAVWSFGGAFGLVQGYDGRPLAEPLYDRLIWTLTD